MVVVVDVDPPRGGDRTLDKLASPHRKLPQTPGTLTGTGRHHLVQHPSQSIRNDAAKKLGASPDFRGDSS
jgi:Bifunctional DNA primase/polymerase, N-terminal